MAHDPLSDADSILSEEYYGKRAAGAAPAGAPKVAKAQQRPTHYKVICISMYTKDLEKLDQLVSDLKARGLTKANRSALIRAALDQVDLDRVPRGI
ncbi:MAG TPA: hypothetical protein VLM85_27035 [Polyangiaceae bacterium]|nr:hypothetical protein [Polyangiaceae bacterium]